MELAEAAGDEELAISVIATLSRVSWVTGQYDQALAESGQALARARKAGSWSEEYEAATSLGWIHKHQGHHVESRDWFTRALELARSARDLRREARAVSNLGNVLWYLGNLESAVAHHREAIALSRRLGFRRGEASACGSLAVSLRQQGHYESARGFNERHLAIAREIGSRLDEACALGNLGHVLGALGRYAEAMHLHEQQLVLARATGISRMEVDAETDLGTLYRVMGDRARAQSMFAAVKSRARDLDVVEAEAEAGRQLGIMAGEDGDLARARQEMETAVTLARGRVQRETLADILLSYGELLARRDPIEGRGALEEGLALARETGCVGFEVLAMTRLALLAGGDPAPAMAGFAAHAERMYVEHRMEVALALWKLTREAAYLTEAHRLLINLRDHAPAEYRESIIASVPLNREIRVAWEASTA